MPPDKRPNFIKLGISSPFSCTWPVLIDDWKQNSSITSLSQDDKNVNNIFVLRNSKILVCLKNAIDNLKTKNSKNYSDINISDFAISNMNSCLVSVVVYLCGRGTPSDCAIICIPSLKDIDDILETTSFSGPIEEIHEDENHDERINLRNEHKKLLKSLRRKRIREKLKKENQNSLIKSEEESAVDRTVNVAISTHTKRKKNVPPPTKDIVDEYAEKIKSLWLPQAKTVRNSCSREVIGFVKKGDFSFTESQGVGRGYVILSALVNFINLCHKSKKSNKLMQPWVLVRNPTSLQYRFGIIQISF